MTGLFSPLTLRGLTLRNRIGVSPMCQYTATDGFASDWHFVHLGAFATGGAGLVISEAIAVTADGRISPHDLGLWDDAQIPMLRRITDFIHDQGSVAAIQLAHAGRKASTKRPWEGGGVVSPADGGWTVRGPSDLAFSETYPTPFALTLDEIGGVIDAFAQGARRALAAGFRVAELHAAHGYLLHQFMSPLSNARTDAYGGSYENRVRLMHDVATAVRAVWPEKWPVLVRLSATDWVEGGWTLDDSVRLSIELRALGVDLIDCSSAGLDPRQQITVAPGYQVPFARRIRQEAGIPTAAVGLITDAAQADAIVTNGDADLVLLARELLRNPHWPLLAASELGEDGVWPKQYERARPR
jgi:2,4-dienoyl-CoA reductase-like NADH-dependent reductase (Old Yellow Enzyme family)